MHPAEQLNAHSLVKAETLPMQAIVHRSYGTPDVLTFEEIGRPVPGDDDVFIRVRAAGASVGDVHIVTGKPYLIRLSSYGGLPGPTNRVPGAAMSGTVELVGSKVTDFRPGDEVFGQAETGAFAEYLVMPAKLLAHKPKNLSFEEAALVPWGATALQGMRAAGLKPGQRVLVNGASGGVGTWTVQIAKAMGAHVTAICSTRNVELMRSLGADEVIDYTKEDFVQGGRRFDVMMDLVGNRPLSECRSVLSEGGTYIPCSGGGGDWTGPMLRILGGLFVSMFTSQKFKTFVMTPNRDDLLFLKELVETGKAKPVVDRSFPLSQAGAALCHVAEGHARGQTVITI